MTCFPWCQSGGLFFIGGWWCSHRYRCSDHDFYLLFVSAQFHGVTTFSNSILVFARLGQLIDLGYILHFSKVTSFLSPLFSYPVLSHYYDIYLWWCIKVHACRQLKWCNNALTLCGVILLLLLMCVILLSPHSPSSYSFSPLLLFMMTRFRCTSVAIMTWN